MADLADQKAVQSFTQEMSLWAKNYSVLHDNQGYIFYNPERIKKTATIANFNGAIVNINWVADIFRNTASLARIRHER